MSRARVTVLVVVGVLLGLGALAGASSAGGAEPVAVPPTTVAAVPTTAAPTATATPTTAAATVPASTTPVPARVGTEDVTTAMAKDEVDSWSVRRLGTTVAIVVVVLAVLGYAYGKVRSAARRATSSALVSSAD